MFGCARSDRRDLAAAWAAAISRCPALPVAPCPARLATLVGPRGRAASAEKPGEFLAGPSGRARPPRRERAGPQALVATALRPAGLPLPTLGPLAERRGQRQLVHPARLLGGPRWEGEALAVCEQACECARVCACTRPRGRSKPRGAPHGEDLWIRVGGPAWGRTRHAVTGVYNPQDHLYYLDDTGGWTANAGPFAHLSSVY